MQNFGLWDNITKNVLKKIWTEIIFLSFDDHVRYTYTECNKSILPHKRTLVTNAFKLN